MKFTERNWQTLGVVQDIAREQERSEAQIALAWVVRQPGVTATILGARRAEQLQANLKALDVVLTGDQRERLDKVSALCPAFPYMIFGRNANARLFGGKPVTGWQEQQLTS